MYEAKRIMTKDVVTVRETTLIYDAMNMLIKFKVSGMPVVDADHKLVGIITEKDMVHLLMEEDIKEKQTVEHYMTKNVKSFSQEASAVELGEFFASHAIRRVPIVEDGKLIGIVARRDIIKLILDIRGTLDKT